MRESDERRLFAMMAEDVRAEFEQEGLGTFKAFHEDIKSADHAESWWIGEELVGGIWSGPRGGTRTFGATVKAPELLRRRWKVARDSGRVLSDFMSREPLDGDGYSRVAIPSWAHRLRKHARHCGLEEYGETETEIGRMTLLRWWRGGGKGG